MKKGLTFDGVAELLREEDGNMAAVARRYGVWRSAVHQFVHARPELEAIYHDCREATKDDVEYSLTRAAKAGESWAVCFYLKTQAKDRGYVERQEHDHRGTRFISEELVDSPDTDGGEVGGPPAPGAT